MRDYVLGFAFDSRKEQVALIQKRRPFWQMGKLNGIGGKIELNEMPNDAMIREFKEETGLEWKEWEYFLLLNGNQIPENSWRVFCYRTVLPDLSVLRSTTDEEVVTASTKNIPDDALFNLRWIIPLALDTEFSKWHIHYIQYR